MEIYYQPIETQKEFVFNETTFKQCEHNESTGLYLYERYKNGRLNGYEVVVGVKAKQPDGTIVFHYPSASDFGPKGLFYPPMTNRESLVRSLSIPLCSETREERRNIITYDFSFDDKGRKITRGI